MTPTYSLLDMVAFQSARLTGSESDHFQHRVYSNGLFVPVPCDLASDAYTELQVREVFCKALSRTIDVIAMNSEDGSLPDGFSKAAELAKGFCQPVAVN